MPVPRGMHVQLARDNKPEFPASWRVCGTFYTRPDYLWVAYIETKGGMLTGNMRRMYWPRIHSRETLEWKAAWGFRVRAEHMAGWQLGLQALERVWRHGLEEEAIGTVLHVLKWGNAEVGFACERPWAGITCYTMRRTFKNGGAPLTMKFTADRASGLFALWDELMRALDSHGYDKPIISDNTKYSTMSGVYDD